MFKKRINRVIYLFFGIYTKGALQINTLNFVISY